MSFILKTNNRKKVSGSTLVAKIVSPDCKDWDSRRYPVTVSVQGLSDKECVIRDIQQIDSILCSNNEVYENGFLLGNNSELSELGIALNSAVNGSSVSEVTIVDEQENLIDDNSMIQITNGNKCKVIHRPPYNPKDENDLGDDEESYKSVDISVTVSKGDYSEKYIRTIYVKPYTADEVALKITQYLQDDFWNCIKGEHNISTDKVFDNFNADFIKNANGYSINKIYGEINKRANNDVVFNKDNENLNISFEVVPPAFFANLDVYNDENCTLSRMSASSMYMMKVSSDSNTLSAGLNIEPVRYFDKSTDEYLVEAIGLDQENKQSYTDDGYIFAYSCTGNNNNSKFKCNVSVQGISSNEVIETNNIKLISQGISFADIMDNIYYSTFVRNFVSSASNKEDSLGEKRGSGKYNYIVREVNLPNQGGMYMRIPMSIKSLFSVGDGLVECNKEKKIGYIYIANETTTDADPFKYRDLFQTVTVSAKDYNSKGESLFIVNNIGDTGTNNEIDLLAIDEKEKTYNINNGNDLYLYVPYNVNNYINIKISFIPKQSLFKDTPANIEFIIKFIPAQS